MTRPMDNLVMGTGTWVWVPVFMLFFCNISDGLVIHASNSGELSWPDIEQLHNLLNNTCTEGTVLIVS